MKSKIRYEWDDIQPVYNEIHKLLKINKESEMINKFDIQMNRVHPVVYFVLLDFLIDNEYYLFADRYFENCVSQGVDIQSQLDSESALDSFMTYFDAKQFKKVDYFLNNGFDISVHIPWLVILLDEAEYNEVMGYIDLYNRKVKIGKIKSKILN